MYSKEELSSFSYKDLQGIAKGLSIAANGKKDVIISNILLSQESKTTIIVEEEVAVIMTEEVIMDEVSTAKKDNDDDDEIFMVGNVVEVFVSNLWVSSVIERINKKTIRAKLMSDNSSHTVKMTDVRRCVRDDKNAMDGSISMMVETEAQICSSTPIKISSTPTKRLSIMSNKSHKSVETKKELVVEEEEDEVEVEVEQEVEEESLPQIKMEEEEEEEQQIDVDCGVENNYDVENDSADEEEQKGDVPQAWALSMEACLSELTTNVTFKKREQSKAPIWNSSTKNPLQSSTPNLKKRKSFSNTPLNIKNQPAILPKSTKAQNLRQEAIHHKMHELEKTFEKDSQGIPFVTVPTPVLSSSSSSVPAINLKSAVPTPLTLVTTVSRPMSSGNKFKTKSAPDFSKLHTHQFNSMKPITDICKQDEEIGNKMTVAMNEAHNCSTSSSSVSSVKPKSVISSTSATNAGTTGAVPFKARKLPNFYSKNTAVGPSTTSTATKAIIVNKENVKSKQELSIHDRNRIERQKNYQSNIVDKRASKIHQARTSISSNVAPTATNISSSSGNKVQSIKGGPFSALL